MLRWAALVVFAAIASAPLLAQEPDAALQRAFHAFTTSWQSGDADAWSRVVDDNGMVEHTNGDVHVKRDEVEHIRSGTSKMSPRIDGEERVTLTSDGNGATLRYVAESGLVSEFWLRKPDGEWLLQSHWDGWGHRPVLKGLVHAD